MALPFWSLTEEGERVPDHYLLSLLNQLPVAQPPILPVPGAAQPAGLSGETKERSCCRHLATIAHLYPYNTYTICTGSQAVDRSTDTRLANDLFPRTLQPEFQNGHHETDFWIEMKN